jgi:signal transduction histidine kinase
LMQQQAQTYALAAAVQAEGVALDPATNFMPGQAHTIATALQQSQQDHVFAPYISTGAPAPTSVTIALLIAPNRHVVASSYPARYPAGMAVAALLPEQRQAIIQALAGQASTGAEQISSASLGYAAEPVWSKTHQPIGAVFLQVPSPQRASSFSRLLQNVLSIDTLVLLLLVMPVGLFFGWLTTRGLVRRVRQLALAASSFAAGDYRQRVNLSGHQDEIGQLEQQFNQMAEQLVEQITRRQHLAEQKARLEERSRISRDLHDAISQDLFSLSLLAGGLQDAVPPDSPFQRQISTLELTTNRVIRDMRALLLELRPTSLEHLSLEKALEELAAAYRTRLGITITTTYSSRPLEASLEHALLRITQEALSNAARHGQATAITLALTSSDEAIELCIQDNGRGFYPEDASVRHGLGLRVLRERVEELHGSLELESHPGRGTTLTVWIPLEEGV